ncbi:hypothetical protein Dimus_005363 [Dionaea muscipula]
MMDNGLSNVMNLIKRQKLFKRRELIHIDAVKEFYARLTLIHYKKKEVARSKVRGVDIEFDNFILASILGIPGNNGICEYINEVWEESKYTKPLEIIRKFANDNMITEARRVKSIDMKPFQRFVHFLVMKNVVPKFGKRNTTSYMDLIYMDHLTSKRMVNAKSYDEAYELAFSVPLIDKQGEEPKRYDYFEETFLTMCQLKRENGVWWLGTGDHRRRYDDVEEVNNDDQAVNEEEQNPDFDWEAVDDEAALQGESGSGEKFFDAEDEVQGSEEVSEDVPDMTAPTPVQQKEKAPAGVDPLALTGSIPESVMSKLQAEFERARANRIQADLEKAQAENARLLALLQQAQSQPKP